MIKKTDSIQLIGDGDSITQGVDGRNTQDYVLRVLNLMKDNGFSDVVMNSYGIGGETTKELIADWDAKVKPNIIPSRKKILLIMESVNAILNEEVHGILGAKTGRENWDDMATYITQAKDDGIDYVILVTSYYPRTVSGNYNQVFWTEDRLLMQKEYFEMSNKIGIIDADVVVDLRKETTLGGLRSQAHNPLYFDDSIHLLGVGYNLLGDFVFKEGIEKLKL